MPFLPPNQQRQSTEGPIMLWQLLIKETGDKHYSQTETSSVK